jgi:hypothetical protein
LDLVKDILLARHADGDHEDQRGRADHHAKSGESEAQFVAAESVIAKTDDLAENQLGRTSGGSCGDRCHIG